MTNPKVRALLLFFLVLTFGVLIFGGYLINKEKPPIPASVRSVSGEEIFTHKDIMDGQNFYFSRGGQDIGSIWGHGSYLPPDWSADFVHRMGLFVAARYLGKDQENAAQFTQKDFDDLDSVTRARASAQVQEELKPNRFGMMENGVLTFTQFQTEAFHTLEDYYTNLFREGNGSVGLRAGIVQSKEEGHILTSFFAWLAWCAVTNRPGEDYTYTGNWPYDSLVGNHPLANYVIWSIVSVILLILGIAVAVFLYLHYIQEGNYTENNKLLDFKEPDPTPSQKATLPYFLVAISLFVIQIATGAITGHFLIEGNYFFGIKTGDILPYTAVRTWHVQLGLFFIATCFLAAGLFIGPFVGKEPKHQSLFVKLLFGAVVVVVLGALSGTYLSVMGKFEQNSFYFGHQGYEYIELGRVWQVLLIIGMIGWLLLVLRAILPALREEKDKGGLTHMLLYSTITIPLFYMAGLMYGKGSHISDAEYWRWWVVHLWVEGFFEAFATIVMAFLLSHIGVVSKKFALITVYFNITLYLGSGVIGTFHHLFWTGSPTPIVALGGVFSALEVVPLCILGFEVAHNLKVINTTKENYAYKWPIYFFISVAFWNLVGAGIFGFLINPPIVLYYIQATNTTPIHSHTALFGVYGLLAISLLLFSVRHIVKAVSWSDRLLKYSFWGLNVGLFSMALFSLVPAGFYQMYFAVKDGLWFARSPEVATSPFIKLCVYLRIPCDIVFASGAIIFLIFLCRAIYLSFLKKSKSEESKPDLN